MQAPTSLLAGRGLRVRTNSAQVVAQLDCLCYNVVWLVSSYVRRRGTGVFPAFVFFALLDITMTIMIYGPVAFGTR